MMRENLSMTNVILLAVSLSWGTAGAGTITLEVASVDGGGGRSAGGSFGLVSTMGQLDAGVLSGSTLTFRGGFLGYALDKITPVLVDQLQVAARGAAVEVTWVARGVAGEVFDVWRARALEGPEVRVSPGEGIAVDARGEGRFLDTTVRAGERYVYHLGIRGGESEEMRLFAGEVLVPGVAFALHQNTPNPFNPITRIHFDLEEESDVRLVVLDASGREVRRLLSDRLDAGSHRATWNGADDLGRALGSGVYFYRLAAGDRISTRKLMLLR